MRYKFSDILNDEIYNKCRVMLITGPYDIFNSMVVDTLKYKCSEGKRSIIPSVDLSNDFEFKDSDADGGSNVDIDTFKEVVDSPSINGLWLCICDYGTLSKKQKGFVDMYMRNPSENGVLIMYSTEFMQYKDIARSRVFNASRVSHIIQLSFPDRAVLKQIVKKMFGEKGKIIDSNALDYFLIKVNRAYDTLEGLVNKVSEEAEAEVVDTLAVKRGTKGVENFTLDDFIVKITEPLSNGNTNNKKIYRMMVAMIEQYGADRLVSMLIREVDTYIELRVLINSGIIPIKINYFYKDVMKNIDEKSKLAKMTEINFRRKARIAAQTSLMDWQYIRLILSAYVNIHTEEASFRAIYDVVTRSTLSENRINNIIGVDNIINRSYMLMDRVIYPDGEEGES